MGLFDKFKKKDNIKDEEVLKYSSENYVIKDNYKSKEYFLKQLQQINFFINHLYNLGKKYNSKPDYSFISKYLFKKICILYVLGAEPDIIKQNIVEMKNTMENITLSGSKLQYTDTVNLISLYYLFNLNISDIEFIKSKMVDEKYVDAILDILTNKVFDNKIMTTKDYYLKEKISFFPDYNKDNNGLMNVINSNNTEIRNQEFKKYLNEVKTKHYNRLLKEYEKADEGKYTYLGTFDFKLTALAKILDIDKNILKDSKFIATDLL